MAIAHDLRQHFCTGHDRHPSTTSRRYLWVITRYRRRHHNHVSTGTVLLTMPDEHLNAHAGQPVCHGTLTNVRAGHIVALVLQDLGNTAHASTANPHKMNIADTAHLGHLIDQRGICGFSHLRPPNSNSRLSPLHRGEPASLRPSPCPESGGGPCRDRSGFPPADRPTALAAGSGWRLSH